MEATDPIVLGDDEEEEDVELDLTEQAVVQWIQSNLEVEIERLGAAGVQCEQMSVKNMAIVREDSEELKKAIILNRIEANTTFDFDQVAQILISQVTPCPVQGKLEYSYVNLILIPHTQQDESELRAFILPYMFDTKYANNDLVHWVFFNNSLQRSQHSVQGYTEIQ